MHIGLVYLSNELACTCLVTNTPSIPTSISNKTLICWSIHVKNFSHSTRGRNSRSCWVYAAEATRFSFGVSLFAVSFMAAACTAVRAIVVTISGTVQPRLKSFTGFLSPCSNGPIATAPVVCTKPLSHQVWC